MPNVVVHSGEGDLRIGVFEVDQLPRAGEDLVIPWPADEFGVRIFTVGEVLHVAAGVDEYDNGNGEPVNGPVTFLRYCEEIT